MTNTDAAPPPEPPRKTARTLPRWLPFLLVILVLIALALLASTCTNDDSANNRPTYQGAERGDSPPAKAAPIP
jgi:hypothetical protein